MHRTAVFVDAGYFFAQGSALLAGIKQNRPDINLDTDAAVRAIKHKALERTVGAALLRIYWYDGALRGGATLQQEALARKDDVKLRLGFINSQGQQKGVDSLIVTDMIDLARNRAITDAVLLSGDEDVRIGVQIAQSFGVRVHLLGIAPSRGSQSLQLIYEADTTDEFTYEDVDAFMSITRSQASESYARSTTSADVAADESLAELVQQFIDGMDVEQRESLREHWRQDAGNPSDIDADLLRFCGRGLNRQLGPEEKRDMRRIFKTIINAGSQGC